MYFGDLIITMIHLVSMVKFYDQFANYWLLLHRYVFQDKFGTNFCDYLHYNSINCILFISWRNWLRRTGAYAIYSQPYLELFYHMRSIVLDSSENCLIYGNKYERSDKLWNMTATTVLAHDCLNQFNSTTVLTTNTLTYINKVPNHT